jgi:hypothetical protein
VAARARGEKRVSVRAERQLRTVQSSPVEGSNTRNVGDDSNDDVSTGRDVEGVSAQRVGGVVSESSGGSAKGEGLVSVGRRREAMRADVLERESALASADDEHFEEVHVEGVVGASNVVDDNVVHLDRIGDDVGDDGGVERLAASELEEKRAAK